MKRKKKLKRHKRNQVLKKEKKIDVTLEIKMTELYIEVLDYGIIFKGDDDNIQSLFVLI